MSLYVLSPTLQAAINAGNPQRVLIDFFAKPDGEWYENDQGVVERRSFSNEDILMTEGIRLTSEFNSETDLTIGMCPSAQIRFSMLNDNGQLEDFEFGYFRAYIGAKIDSMIWGRNSYVKEFVENGETLYYEFAPLGVFFAQRPDIVRKKIIEVDANDLMVLFDKEMPEGLINYTNNTTLYNIAHALCGYVNPTSPAIVTLKRNSWDNSDIKVTSEPEQFKGATMREVIGWIAEAACANAVFNREGQLEFRWFTTVDRTYDEHDYSEFTATWYETKPIDGLNIRNADSTAELPLVYNEQTGDIDRGTGTNVYMIQDNPFLRQPEASP